MNCWWCCHEIPNEVYHLPYKFENEKFHTCGQFCGWACVKAYNIYSGSPRVGQISDIITLFRKRMYGKITSVQAAPPRFSLKSFGGKLTIEEFRNGVTRASVIIPNERWIYVPYEKHVPHETILETDALVLRRIKPLKRDQNSIQKLLNLKKECST